MATIRIISSTTFRSGTLFKVAVFMADDTNAALTGETVTYAIRRSDGKWWDAVDVAWENAKVNNATTEISAVDLQGVYESDELSHEDMDPGLAEANWYIEVTNGTVTETRVLSMRHDLLSAPVGDTVVADPVVTLTDLWRALKVVLTHNHRVDDSTKQLIHYQEDGTTPALTFDLKDAAGNASVREPFERQRV